MFIGEIFRLARIRDLDLLQHLPDDDLNVLVIDIHALKSINFLNLVHEISSEFLDPFDGKNIVRGWISVDDVIAFFDKVARLQIDVLTFWDKIFDRIRTIIWNKRNTPLVLVVLAELDRA